MNQMNLLQSIPGYGGKFVLQSRFGLQNIFSRAKKPFFTSFSCKRFINRGETGKARTSRLELMNQMKVYEVVIFNADLLPYR